MSRKIKTKEDLDSLLQQDLAWRKKEMVSMRILVSKNETDENILLRSGLALLCAHFEGFIKFAANSYVRYVSSQGILNNLLKSNFSAINLRKSFKDCSNTEKISVHQRLVARYDELTNKPFFVSNDVITTHSNPSSEEISEILSSIGITT